MLTAPADVEIVAATTAGIGFARIAARRQLREVGTDALAFSLVEANAVARGEPGILISEPDIHLLWRSEEHTSELQSLMRISYAVFCLKKQQPHAMTTY